MSEPEQEPENYSLDAMMNRLKVRPPSQPEDGELVTREDGSVAVRVRKRKRRSHQPHKEKEKRVRRLRVVQLVLLMAGLSAVFLVGGGFLVYHNTPGYRAKLTRRLGEWLGANVELTQFRASPVGCEAATATFAWPATSWLREASATNLTGDLSLGSFFREDLRGEEMTADALTLRFDSNPLAVSGLHSASQSPAPVDFRYRVNKLDADFGDVLKPCLRLRGVEASFYQRDEIGTSELRLKKGSFIIPEWQSFSIDRSLIEFRDGRIQVVDFRLLDPTNNKGTIELKGQIDPADTARPAKLDLHVEGVALSQIGGLNLSRLLDGRINTREREANPSSVRFLPGNFSSLRTVAAFESNAGSHLSMSGLPFLKTLTHLTDDDWYEHPNFDLECSGVITRSPAGVELDNLRLECRNRLAIRGSIHLDRNDQLGGTLEVGLPEEIVRNLHFDSLKRTFPESRDGYRWAKTRLSGTSVKPVDTLQKSLSQAPTTDPASSTDAAPADPAKEFEKITQPH